MKRKYMSMIFGVVFMISRMPLLMNVYAQEPGVRYVSFNSDRTGNHDIYIIDTNGRNLRNLTDHPARDFSVTWAPDGRSFAYVSDRDGNYEIYVMDLNKMETRRLTNHPAEDKNPDWSPDGRWIAFESNREGIYHIYKMNISGGKLQQLTDEGEFNSEPAWSPDGKHIAFNSTRGPDSGIYVMESNRIKPIKLKNGTGAHPTWSPDGKQIAFSRPRDGILRSHALFMVSVDGRGLRQLTNDPQFHYQPAWSLNGEWIAYVSKQDIGAGGDIYVVNVAGKPIRRLTNDEGKEYSPAWVPAGFLSVSPTVEKQTTLWGRLKQPVHD